MKSIMELMEKYDPLNATLIGTYTASQKEVCKHKD
jgi:hypothetical protein